MSVKALGENALRAVGTMTLTLRLMRPNDPAEAGRAQIKAKYILVWQKIEGEWKIDSGIGTGSVRRKLVVFRRLRQSGPGDLVRVVVRAAAGWGQAVDRADPVGALAGSGVARAASAQGAAHVRATPGPGSVRVGAPGMVVPRKHSVSRYTTYTGAPSFAK